MNNMNKHYIYFHYNPINKNLFYIGVGYKKRAWSFKWGRSKHYLNYINKYGNPIVEIYKDNLTEYESYMLEEQLISKFGRQGIDKDGLLVNKSSGGKTSAKGNKQYITEEWKQKIGDSNRGKTKHTSNSKSTIGDKNSKLVHQYDMSNNFIQEWKSQLEASKQLNINYKSINNCAKGVSKSAGGYIWKIK
jgi:hypothetical protein